MLVIAPPVIVSKRPSRVEADDVSRRQTNSPPIRLTGDNGPDLAAIRRQGFVDDGRVIGFFIALQERAGGLVLPRKFNRLEFVAERTELIHHHEN